MTFKTFFKFQVEVQLVKIAIISLICSKWDLLKVPEQ